MASATKDQVLTDEGGTFLPATQRPDGSWRKPRRVKPGYVPQEEVPLYESKGKQWMSSKPRLPPGVYEEPAQVVEEHKQPLSKSAKKNEKRKQKRKEKIDEDISKNTPTNQNGVVERLATQVQQVSIVGDASASEAGNTQKRLKNVKKKLRQISDLEEKIASGELAAPSKEQLEKISRKAALEEELRTLEEGS